MITGPYSSDFNHNGDVAEILDPEVKNIKIWAILIKAQRFEIIQWTEYTVYNGSTCAHLLSASFNVLYVH